MYSDRINNNPAFFGYYDSPKKKPQPPTPPPVRPEPSAETTDVTLPEMNEAASKYVIAFGPALSAVTIEIAAVAHKLAALGSDYAKFHAALAATGATIPDPELVNHWVGTFVTLMIEGIEAAQTLFGGTQS